MPRRIATIVTVTVLAVLAATGLRAEMERRSVRPDDAAAHRRSVTTESTGTFAANSTATPSQVTIQYPETHFVPVKPCRIVDTRSGGGAMTVNQTRSFVVTGGTGFAAQGGASAGCGIPDGIATAIAANLTAVDGTGPGYMRAWATNDPQVEGAPNATILNYSPALNASNAAAIPICDEFLFGPGTDCSKEISVKNFAATSHLIIDVTGYYAHPIYAYLLDTETGEVDGSRVVSSTKTGTGTYEIEFEGDLLVCAVTGSIDDATSGEVSVGLVSASEVIVETYDSTGARADRFFEVVVTC